MAHTQKPDFVFRRNGRVHLNGRGRQSVQSTTGGRGVRVRGSNVGYIMFRGSAKSTGYTLHSPVSPSLPLRCFTVCHHISTGIYLQFSCNSKTLQEIFPLVANVQRVYLIWHDDCHIIKSSLHCNHTGVTTIGIYVFSCSLHYSDSECSYLHVTSYQMLHLIAVVTSMTRTLVMMI